MFKNERRAYLCSDIVQCSFNARYLLYVCELDLHSYNAFFQKKMFLGNLSGVICCYCEN